MTESKGMWPQHGEEAREHPVPHYYGDRVRSLFIGVVALLLISIPLDHALLSVNAFLGVFGVLFIAVLAGYTNPRSTVSVFIDACVAALLFVSYEYFAIDAYLGAGTFVDPIVLLRQCIAVLSLLSLYYSVKTLRSFSYRGPTNS